MKIPNFIIPLAIGLLFSVSAFASYIGPKRPLKLDTSSRVAFANDVNGTFTLEFISNDFYDCPTTINHTTWKGQTEGSNVLTLPHNTIIQDGERCEGFDDGKSLVLFQSDFYNEDFTPAFDGEPDIPQALINYINNSGFNKLIVAALNRQKRESNGETENYFFGYEENLRECGGKSVFRMGTTAFVVRPYNDFEIYKLDWKFYEGKRYLIMVPRYEGVVCVYSNLLRPEEELTPAPEEESDPENPSEPDAAPSAMPTQPHDGDSKHAEDDSHDGHNHSGSKDDHEGPDHTEEPKASDSPKHDHEDKDHESHDNDDKEPGGHGHSNEPEPSGSPEHDHEEDAEATGEPKEDHEGHGHEDHDHDHDGDGKPDHGAHEHDEHGLDEPEATPEASGEPEETVCFPASSRVTLSDGSLKRMDALRVGDVVYTGAGKTSDVFGFSHADGTVKTSFIAITTKSGHTMHATPRHFVYANNMAVPADHVIVGDVMNIADGSVSEVTNVRLVTLDGVYNPQTNDGNIIVDGIQATTFTKDVLPPFAHAALTPFRALHRVFRRDVLSLVLDGGVRSFVNMVPKSRSASAF